MKKNIKKVLFLMFLPIFMVFTSCDELSELALNIPLVIEFSASGTNTTVSETEFFCLSQYDEWRDNQEDIENAEYVAASYGTLAGSSPNLNGNVSFALYDGLGNLIFTVSLGNITAADYISTPYELSLTADQVNAFNSILANLPNNDGCFTGELRVTDITGQTNANGEYVLNGKVEIVVEATVKTD